MTQSTNNFLCANPYTTHAVLMAVYDNQIHPTEVCLHRNTT